MSVIKAGNMRVSGVSSEVFDVQDLVLCLFVIRRLNRKTAKRRLKQRNAVLGYFGQLRVVRGCQRLEIHLTIKEISIHISE